MTIQTISPKDLLVYLCLRRYKDEATGVSAVPITQIVVQTGAAPVTVLHSLKRLESLGHIEYVKKGRSNYYTLRSDIDASSYDFLDEPISHNEKIQAAMKVAVTKPKTKPKDKEADRHYGYMLDLEKTVVQLNDHVRLLTDELNKTRRLVSSLTGIECKPIPEPFTQDTEKQ